MTTHRTSLRAILAQLAQDLAEAVLDAVRGASMSELAEVIQPGGPRRTQGRPRRPASATTRPAAPGSETTRTIRAPRARATPVRRGEPAPVAEAVDLTEAYPDVAIVDPYTVLAGLEQSASPPVILTTPTDDAVASAPEEARAPVAPAGEDVLRSAGGEAVLRRRRSPRSSDVSGGTIP